MNRVFVDSGPFISFCIPKDQYYSQARSVINVLLKQHAQLITTEYVVNEAATYLLTSIRGGYHRATLFLDWLERQSMGIHTEWIGKDRFQKTITVFRRFNKDKTWSFTDCSSYVVIKELKIDKVFTFDEHFKEMGLSVL